MPLRVVISPRMADKKDDLPLPTWPTTMVSLPTKQTTKQHEIHIRARSQIPVLDRTGMARGF